MNKLMQTSQRSVTVTMNVAKFVQVLPNNDKRVGVILSANGGAGVAKYSWDPSSPFAGGGFTISGGFATLISADDIGNVITQPLYANDNGSGNPLTVIEIIAPYGDVYETDEVK